MRHTWGTKDNSHVYAWNVVLRSMQQHDFLSILMRHSLQFFFFFFCSLVTLHKVLRLVSENMRDGLASRKYFQDPISSLRKILKSIEKQIIFIILLLLKLAINLHYCLNVFLPLIYGPREDNTCLRGYVKI